MESEDPFTGEKIAAKQVKPPLPEFEAQPIVAAAALPAVVEEFATDAPLPSPTQDMSHGIGHVKSLASAA
eukprot:972682-Amphidinium_carterae.1